MKLKEVRIRGFKSIKDTTVRLGDINVLIGPNGSGKSNFISALSFLQNVLDKNLQRSVRMAGLPSLLYGGLKVTSSMVMKFLFCHNFYGFELCPTEDGRLVFAREFYGRDGTERIEWDISRKTPYGYESEFENGTNDGIDDCVRSLLEAKNWKVYHFHDMTPQSSVKQDHDLSDAAYMQHDASNIASFLYMLKRAYPVHYNDILRTVRMVAPCFGDFDLEPNTENRELIRLRWKQTGCDEVFSINQLSDGMLRFICLATLLLQPPALQPSVIILDEPELGLHPYAISVLAEMVHIASLKKQLIISTQSADLLNCFDADDVIVAELTQDGSVYRHLSSQDLGAWLEEYALSDIWKKNIFGGQP